MNVISEPLGVLLRDEFSRTRHALGLAMDVLAALNTPNRPEDAIRGVVTRIRDVTGVEAVGIRLREGDDFPYYVAQGFPAEFIERGASLCRRDRNGAPVRDERGRPQFACMCGTVLSGHSDPSLPWFTEGGSFWTNAMSELLDAVPEQERDAYTHIRCYNAGYESVALVPIRQGGRVVGLLQLSDPRPNGFTREWVRFFEGLGASIGIALSDRRAEPHRPPSRQLPGLTEPGRMEQTLTRHAELADSILATSMDGFAMIERSGRFRQVNPALCDITGYTAEELLRMNLTDLEAQENPEQVSRHIERVVENGPDRFETKHRRKGGAVIDVEISTHYGALGRDGFFYTFVRDMTDQKRLECELVEIGVRERNRIGQDLHDAVCSRLSGLALIGETLGRRLADRGVPEAADVARMVDIARESIEHCRKLAHGLCPIGPAAEGLMQALDGLAKQTEQLRRVTCRFLSAGAATVDDPGVADHLYHIAQEAIENAVRHGQASEIAIDLDATNGEIVLSVRDNGIGLPDEPPDAPGVGLRIMQRRARLINAALHVGNNEQRGAVVRCIVPSGAPDTKGPV